MKFSYLGLGVVIVIIALFFLRAKWNVYDVERYGQLVEMRIVRLPNYCGLTRGKYYMEVTYQGETFNKRIPTRFCDKHKIGEIIKMKHLEGQESILFPEERVRGEFVAIGIFILVGILSIFYGIFNRQKRIYK